MLPSELRLASGSVGPSALHSVRQCFKMVCAPVYRVACVLISLHTFIIIIIIIITGAHGIDPVLVSPGTLAAEP